MENLIQTIENVSLILDYWLPGSIFLYTFYRLTGRKIDDIIAKNIVAVVISTCVKVALSMFDIFNIAKTSIPFEAVTACSCIISVIIAMLFVLLYRAKWFNRLVSRIFAKSVHDNIWEDVVDYANGTTTIRATLKNGNVVIGGVNAVEENGSDSWIVLDYYSVFDNDHNELATFGDADVPSVMMVKASDILIAQVYNGNNI